MPLCHIAFGGNVGDPGEAFARGLDRIEQLSKSRVRKVSRLYRTVPMGDHAGAPFLNGAAELETEFDPHMFLAMLHEVEKSLGRTRELHWGPRPIDLDLIFYEDRIVESPDLILPHPACWHRRFVLDPLAEIAGAVVHPVKQLTVAELRDRLRPRPLRVSVTGGESVTRERTIATLAAEFNEIAMYEWNPSDAEPAILFWLGDSERAHPPFASLPLVPRLNVAEAGRRDGSEEPLNSMRYVLQSALDCPTPVDR